MEDEIFKLVTRDDDAVQAALAISGAMDFKQRALEAFKGPITALVKEAFHGTVEYNVEGDWSMIQVEVMGGNYILDVNYDWKSFEIEVGADEKERSPQVEKRIAEEMVRCTNHPSVTGAKVFALWGTNRYPSLESVNEALYFYRLCKVYIERPQEVADRIISIARSLENMTA
jgi:hypothetical protein